MNYFAIPGCRYINTIKLSRKDREKLFLDVFKQVCKVFNEDYKTVLENNTSRKDEYVLIRMVCMCIFNKKYRFSLEISAAYFDKDGATVYNAIKRVREARETNKHFKNKTDRFLSGVDLTGNTRHYFKKSSKWEAR